NAHNDILCRDPDTLEIAPPGTSGVMQVLSVLPTSYPGFSILTEDLGTVHGDGGCPCGQPGKYFSIHGRLEQAEIRGCSDTYEAAA
ncbi:MAG: acyl-protein synthetase, partial [Pseudomonadota bacterium]